MVTHLPPQSDALCPKFETRRYIVVFDSDSTGTNRLLPLMCLTESSFLAHEFTTRLAAKMIKQIEILFISVFFFQKYTFYAFFFNNAILNITLMTNNFQK